MSRDIKGRMQAVVVDRLAKGREACRIARLSSPLSQETRHLWDGGDHLIDSFRTEVGHEFGKNGNKGKARLMRQFPASIEETPDDDFRVIARFLDLAVSDDAALGEKLPNQRCP